MKIKFLKSIIFISLFLKNLAVTPVWDFNNISIDLLGSKMLYEYTIYNRTEYNTNVSLVKSITNVAGTLVAENYLTINTTKKPVTFENIDSFYLNKLGHSIVICPKGKFHPYDFVNNVDIAPPEFEEDGNWDLKCYSHETGFFLIFYLMNNNINFYYSLNTSNEITKCVDCFYTYIYDFIIENGNQDKNYYYKFPCIRDDAGYLRFDGKNILLNSQENRLALADHAGVLEIIQSKGNTKAYFDEDNNFYFFTYSNIFDFTSGYVKTNINLMDSSEYSIADSQIDTNTSSPFLEFDFNSYIKIKEISFIHGTNLVYYIINYENDNKYYYGLVDIKLNKILYNIENEFISFLPYSKTEMLAITSTSAYLICITKSGNSCIKTCPYDKLIIEKEGNACIDYCDPDKIKLIPEGICINRDDCDLNIYSLNNEETECGLCSYFYPSGEKYKLINSTFCLSSMPDNTEFYNEELLLLKCKADYHLVNNECIPDFCYETCNSCSKISDDVNNQYCLSCKEGYSLNNGNCITITVFCHEGFFLGEDNLCYNCTNECKNYKENICNCSSCHNGFYIEEQINRCRKCNKICDIYEDNSCFCESCPANYELINKTCVECTGCKFSQISHCNCSICNEGYYLDDDYKCKKCIEVCSSYKENTCICDSQYSFYGYYSGISESINLLKTDNLTNIENNILQIIQSKLDRGEINLLYINEGKYFFTEVLETKFIIYKTEEENDIKIKIDLGECADKLKVNKSLSQNISLYVLYIEKGEEGMEIPKTSYEIYYHKSDENIYEKMDLGVCKDMKINKSVYINISDDDLDKYNSSSGYYNDICYTYTSNNGTDVTLKDRRNEYINNNMAVCEENCDFIAYDSVTNKAICSCPVSESVSQVSDMKFDKEKLKSNFINFKNIANISMLKCYHLLFSSKIIKNIGCIIISLIILIELVNMIIFYSYEYNIFHKKIKDIFEVKLFEGKENNLNINNIKEKDIKNINKKNTDEIKIFEKKIGTDKRKSKKRIKKKSKIRNKRKNNNQKNNHNPPKKVLEENSTNNINNNTNNIIKNNQIKNIGNINFENKSNKVLNSLDDLTLNEISSSNNKKNNKINNEIMKYIDTELNLLSYKEAINDDKRTYCQYYASLLRTRHLLVFSFYNNKDYNSRIIKINLFFFTFSVNYTINALFFNDSTMHKIYEDGGKFNFIYQIPQILYSSIISTVLIMLVKFLALSEKNVLKIKNSKENELTKIYNSETKTIKNKFICFFIIIYILLLIFWYYVGCFCAIYKNTQIHLLTDTLISFATSLSYPLGLYLLPGIFRISSLRDETNKSEYLYNFGKIIQLFV